MHKFIRFLRTFIVSILFVALLLEMSYAASENRSILFGATTKTCEFDMPSWSISEGVWYGVMHCKNPDEDLNFIIDRDAKGAHTITLSKKRLVQ